MSYAHPEVLVDIGWLQKNLNAPNTRIVEVDYDPRLAYEQGHIPGAVLIDWRRDMNDPVQRDIIGPEAFEKLMSRLGIANDTTVILYGDYNNWFAAFAFWVFKLYDHRDVRLLNGGRKKWIDSGGELSKETPSYPATSYKVPRINLENRIFLTDLLKIRAANPNAALVDVRSPAEYRGEITAPPEYPEEAAQRGGHIPGAVNIPWGQAVRDDGTFKPVEELRQLYEPRGVTPDKEVITYCRIGERASHTWFVLKYLLGYKNVKVYDGSWSEWGNLVRFPIEKEQV